MQRIHGDVVAEKPSFSGHVNHDLHQRTDRPPATVTLSFSCSSTLLSSAFVSLCFPVFLFSCSATPFAHTGQMFSWICFSEDISEKSSELSANQISVRTHFGQILRAERSSNTYPKVFWRIQPHLLPFDQQPSSTPFLQNALQPLLRIWAELAGRSPSDPSAHHGLGPVEVRPTGTSSRRCHSLCGPLYEGVLSLPAVKVLYTSSSTFPSGPLWWTPEGVVYILKTAPSVTSLLSLYFVVLSAYVTHASSWIISSGAIGWTSEGVQGLFSAISDYVSPCVNCVCTLISGHRAGTRKTCVEKRGLPSLACRSRSCSPLSTCA